MATITTEQKVIVTVSGVTAAGKPADLSGGTITYIVSDPAVAVIGEEAGLTAKVVGLAAGQVTVTVTFTSPTVTLSAVSESVDVTAADVVSIEVVLGPVENQ